MLGYARIDRICAKRVESHSMEKKAIPLTSDLGFKKLFEDENLLKSMLQNFLPIPKGSVVEDVRWENTEKRPGSAAEPIKKTFILDLKVRIRRKEEGRLL